MAHFLTETKAEIDVGRFDNMMDEIKGLLSMAGKTCFKKKAV